MNLKVFFSIFGFLANSLTCISQISINSGGLFDNRNYEISSSIGQVFYSSTPSIIEGVHYISEDSTPTKIDNVSNFNFNIYPNPFKDELFIDFEDNFELKNVKYKIINLSGTVIKEDLIIDKKTKLKIINLSNSLYFIQFFNNDIQFKSFNLSKYED